MQEKEIIDHLSTFYAEHDVTGFNVFDFIYVFGSPLQAIMYLKLFWPEFVEIKDMIFLKDRVEDKEDKSAILEAFARHKGDRLKTEQAFNLVEIPSDIFGKFMGETTEEEDFYIALTLVKMWRCRLQTLYPKRRFKVILIKPEDTGGEVGILFYQERNRSKK
jgi:hypothetical protein